MSSLVCTFYLLSCIQAKLLIINTGHAFLWKHGIEHGDPSLWNVMYNPVKKCGVVADFDLSILAWLQRVPGSDRTGTIPFMALDLLTDGYWKGYWERCYHHEFESCLWMLPVIFLAYEDGKRDRENQFTKDWFTSDHRSCHDVKSGFLFLTRTRYYAIHPKLQE